jgi:hypothetical protein
MISNFWLKTGSLPQVVVIAVIALMWGSLFSDAWWHASTLGLWAHMGGAFTEHLRCYLAQREAQSHER